MPRGDKSSYTSKQKRQAEHIEEGYEKSGVSRREAERRAWATVNKETAAERRAVRAEARRRIAAPPERAARKAEAPRPHARNPPAPHRPGKPPRLGGAGRAEAARAPVVGAPAAAAVASARR